jgi:hypothetical protein
MYDDNIKWGWIHLIRVDILHHFSKTTFVLYLHVINLQMVLHYKEMQ